MFAVGIVALTSVSKSFGDPLGSVKELFNSILIKNKFYGPASGSCTVASVLYGPSPIVIAATVTW